AADSTDKGANLTQVTTNPGSDHEAAWSPDGKWIAHVSQTEPKLFQYATRHLVVSPSGGGEAKVLTRELDRNVQRPRFSPDGQSIYFQVSDDGTENLAAFVLNKDASTISFGGGVAGKRPIGGRLRVAAYSEGSVANGNIAALVATPEHPEEV